LGLFIPETPTVVEEPPDRPPFADGNPDFEAAKPQPRVWFEILAVLCFTLIPAAWSSIEEFLVLGPNKAPEYSDLRVSIVTVLVTYPLLYFIWIARIPFSRIGIVRPRWSDLAVALALLVFQFGIEGVLHRVLARVGVSSAASTSEGSVVLGRYALHVARRVLGAFYEELATRGYLLTRVWDATGSPLFAVLFSAALFGASHLYQGVQSMILASVMGLIYGLGFVFCRRLAPLVLVHAFWNLVIAGR
jgi:membrane protease YdiL (CAAX protease family)